ncbi:MAG: NADH-quinone oxidoreductase subunit M [Pseudomonadota bacterium]
MLLAGVTFLPALGALALLLFVHGDDKQAQRNSRIMTLWTSTITFLVSLVLWTRFDSQVIGFQMVTELPWLEDLGISFRLGVDGISVLFVLLSTMLMPLCILASWQSITRSVKHYMIAFLVLETLMIGTFCALDLVVFYIFFEGVLIPMFLIIGIWGSGEERIYAAFKFFLFTLLGSILLLVAVIYIVVSVGTADIRTLFHTDIPRAAQMWLWLAMFASFAVKMPMWPVHTWLPDAHVQAPTAGSVILAGVLLKMGGYGFLRLSLPILPDASAFFAPMVLTLSVIAIIYASLVALVQQDMKKLIAYSSIAHMGLVTAGIFSFTVDGVQGAILLMVSHGFTSAALFLCVGVLYDRTHTRAIERFGGVVKAMPIFALCFMIFTMASIGLPGTSGFVGEFLALVGLFQVNIPVAIIATFGAVLGAAYMLVLYRNVMYGKPSELALTLRDLVNREIVIFLPLIVLIMWLGLYPAPFFDKIGNSAYNLVYLFENR